MEFYNTPTIKCLEGYGSIALLCWEPKDCIPPAPSPETQGGLQIHSPQTLWACWLQATYPGFPAIELGEGYGSVAPLAIPS
jgi:hypothetical protein